MRAMNLPSILIVEDEEGIRESYKLILENQYDLTFARNGIEALNLLEKQSFAAALLDIKMPLLNGLETLKKIHHLYPKLKVIMVTGYQSVETAREATKHGAFDYLIKPFDSAQILETVRKALQK